VLSGCNFPTPTDPTPPPSDTPEPVFTSIPPGTPTPGVTVFPTDTQTPARGVTLEASGFYLPISIDFSTLSDGPLPSWFNGPTWKISGGRLVNAPTLGDELLSDPGLEADYPGGLGCLTLKQAEYPILAQSADVHSGSKSQQFQASGVNSAIYWTPLAGEIGEWYQFSIWAKRIKGATSFTRLNLTQTGGLPISPVEWSIDSPFYKQGKVSLLSTSTQLITPYAVKQDSDVGLATVVIVDDGSLRKIDKASLFGLLPATQPDVILKIKPDDLADNTQIGIVLRANASSNPTDTILALFSAQPGTPANSSLSVIKVIGSAYTSLAANTPLGARVAGAWFEARASGATVSFWYNNQKIGKDLAIGEPELIDNAYHGVFSAGDNQLKSFFCAGRLIPRVQVYAGSSFTSLPGYRPLVNAYCLSNFPQYDYTFPILAIGGNNTWSNLVRLTTGGDVFILDHANDWTAAWAEAMIRRVWAANPATQIILITSPSWNTLDTSNDSLVNTPANLKVLQEIVALAHHYGIALANYWGWCQNLVNGGNYHLSQLTNDSVHPSAIGYAAMAGLLEPFLPDGGTPAPAALPERYFPNSAAYELPPIRMPGTAYFLRTGKGWSDKGTTITSSKPGDTVTYKTLDVWSSFGSWRSDLGTNVVEISVNGGDFSTLPFNQNGYDLDSVSYDTITIRIPASGGNVRIEEIWFI
jgi:hypothetical protein